MTPRAQSHKITPVHLGRKAVVYLRHSSERQVKQNTESQRLQYALAGRARALGWQEVETIDTDLGRSAAIGAGPREGFERLIASVALGEVGIVLSREVSRRLRTDKDWCHPLEVCQIFGTLIGDAEQIYDLALMDDQLVLGIKATVSIVELKVLKLRLLQGMEEKARRGELTRLLPVGDRPGWDGPSGAGSRSAGAGGDRAGLPEGSRAGQRPPDVPVVSHPRPRAAGEHEPRRADAGGLAVTDERVPPEPAAQPRLRGGYSVGEVRGAPPAPARQ